MNLLIIILAALALLPADTPAFTWTESYPPAGVVTWQGPGDLRALQGGAAPIVATSAEPGTLHTPVTPAPGVQYCVIRGGESIGCAIVPPPPATQYQLLPLVTS